MFWIKNRIYVFQDDTIHQTILKQIHDFSIDDHVERITIYDRVNQHYYWSKMIDIVEQYVKACLHCKRTKVFKNFKQNLFKSLFISERYFQNISVDFIISLFKCHRHERVYQHVIIVVNRLFKKKKYIKFDFMNVQTVIQIFFEWVWRNEEYSENIVSDKSEQFVAHFWQRLCERINIKFKLSIAWHFETNDQIENVNFNFKAYFRVFINYKQDDWLNWFSIIRAKTFSLK